MKCPVVARDRTMQVDESYTIQDAMDYISSKGFEMSLRRTLQLYGLRYVDDRAFSSKYRQEFNLSKTRTLYDIQMKELRQYKDLLTGHMVRGFG